MHYDYFAHSFSPKEKNCKILHTLLEESAIFHSSNKLVLYLISIVISIVSSNRVILF